MAPVQLFIIISALAIFPFAWLRGGRPERAAVGVQLASYVLAVVVQDLRWGSLSVGVAAVDLALWLSLVWLGLRYDRWWLMIAAGAQTLNLMTHPVLLLSTSLTARESIAAQWVFTLVTLYSLLLGVLERRLAGETPGVLLQSSRPNPT